MNKSILTDYDEAKAGLDSIKNEREKLQDSIRLIEKDFDNRINQLRNEKNEAVFEAKKNVSHYETILNIKETSYKGTIASVHRIRDIMNVIMDNPSVSTPKVYKLSDRDENGDYLGWNDKRKIYIDPIKTLINDRYSIINLYIVPNNRPTNKYSLVIRGYSILSELFNERHTYGYVQGTNEEKCNLYATIRNASTKEELIRFAEKYPGKILTAIPKDYNAVTKEYQEVEKALKEKEWQIYYWKNQKHYYEEHYSHGTETDKYKTVLKKLAELKN